MEEGEGEEEVSSQPEALPMSQTFSAGLMCSEAPLADENPAYQSLREGVGGEGEGYQRQVSKLNMDLDLNPGIRSGSMLEVPGGEMFDPLGMMSPIRLSQVAGQLASQVAWDGEGGTLAQTSQDIGALFLNSQETVPFPTLPPHLHSPHQERNRIKTMIGQRLSLAGCVKTKGGGGGGLGVVDGRDGREGEDGAAAQPCLTSIPHLQEEGEGKNTQEVYEDLTPIEHDVALSVEKEGKAKVRKPMKLTSYFPVLNKK